MFNNSNKMKGTAVSADMEAMLPSSLADSALRLRFCMFTFPHVDGEI